MAAAAVGCLTKLPPPPINLLAHQCLALLWRHAAPQPKSRQFISNTLSLFLVVVALAVVVAVVVVYCYGH